MTTEAALTKMAYLLAQPESTPDSVAKEMAVSHRGELTNHSQTVFRHPDGALSARLTALTALGYAIAQGDLQKVQEQVQAENIWILNDADYSGNTPVVRPSILSFPFFCGILTSQHIAAHSPSLEILRFFLLQGASVHLRNSAGRTPLFLAASAGLLEHVVLLRKSGAHLHADERAVAEMQARQRPGVWAQAGVRAKTLKEREQDEAEDWSWTTMAGSAP
jgi:lysophospholipase